MTFRPPAIPRLTVGQIVSAAMILTPLAALYARQQTVGLFAIAAAATLFARHPGRDRPPPGLAAPAALLALLAWGALSLFWTVDLGRSVFVLGTMVALAAAFFVLLWAAGRAGDDTRFAFGRAAAIAAAVGIATIAWEAAVDLAVVKWLWPKIGQVPPTSLVYLNYPLLALAVVLPFAAAHLAAVGRWWAGALLVGAALALAAGLESGTALLAIATTGAGFVLFAAVPARAIRILSVAAVTLALLLPPLIAKEVSRFGPLVSLTERIGDSSRHRLAIWGAVSALIRERPVLGAGIGAVRSLPEANRMITLRDAQGRRTRLVVEMIPTHTHNAGLEIATELGVVGLALALLTVLLALRRAFAVARDRWATAAVGMITCSAAVLWSFGLSVWNAAYIAAWGITLPPLAAWLSAPRPRPGREPTPA